VPLQLGRFGTPASTTAAAPTSFKKGLRVDSRVASYARAYVFLKARFKEAVSAFKKAMDRGSEKKNYLYT
jgi:hypothetical protein